MSYCVTTTPFCERSSGACVATGVLCIAATMAVFGPKKAIEYHDRYLQKTEVPVQRGNQSPYAVLERFLVLGVPTVEEAVRRGPDTIMSSRAPLVRGLHLGFVALFGGVILAVATRAGRSWAS